MANALTAVTTKGLWSEDYVDSLPDGSFLWVQEGGEKDDEWRTVPRALRHWPVRDDDWQIDMARLRAALPEVIDAAEAILPATMKPKVLLKAANMMLREIDIEAPKAGMTPEVSGMITDLITVLTATAALPPVAVQPPAAPAAPAATPAEPPPAAPPDAVAAAEKAKAAHPTDPCPTTKAEVAKARGEINSDDGWAKFEKARQEGGTRTTLLKRKPRLRR